MVGAMTMTYLLFKEPLVFPVVIVLGGLITNFTEQKVRPVSKVPYRPVKWGNLVIFLSIFLLSGIFSEVARKQQWEHRKAFNLFENFYRFGSIVFGGGDVLMPMMYEQYVVRPQSARIQKNNPQVVKVAGHDFLTGAGVVRAIPGPVFSIASYTGGLAMAGEGKGRQMVGCVIGTLDIFLPSALLVLFFYPVWHNLHRYNGIYRALKGINASVVGIMVASTIYLTRDMHLNIVPGSSAEGFINLCIIGCTFSVLMFSRIPAPLVALFCLALGWMV